MGKRRSGKPNGRPKGSKSSFSFRGDPSKLPIGAVAQILGITIDSVLTLDASGILPAHRDPQSGWRIWDRATVIRYKRSLMAL